MIVEVIDNFLRLSCLTQGAQGVLGLFFLQFTLAKGYPTYKICTQKPFREETSMITGLVRTS